jgi:hypothetical protein
MAAVQLARREDRAIIWWRVGEGKTRIALAWCCYISQKPRPLIICSPGAFRQWHDEIELLKLDKIVKPSFLSYGFLSKQSGFELDFDSFNCIVVDELWLYKNHLSRRSRMIRQITNRYPCIGLSGSMMSARNIEEIYGQAKALHLDDKIAPNITAFRRAYCIETTNYAGFIDRYPKKGAVEQITEKLIDNVHIFFPKSRREVRNITVNVEPNLEQARIKRELVKAYYYEHKPEKGKAFTVEVQSATSLLIKLQQVSDGFMHDGQGAFLPVKSSKASKLKELCTELLDAGERVLIWVAFRHTAKMLANLLSVKTVMLTGDAPFDFTTWQHGGAKACVATVGSGASLNDFQDLRYAIFYSCRYSYLNYQQAKGRTDRKASQHPIAYYYHLQTTGFPDRDVYEMLDKSCRAEEYVIRTTTKLIANIDG